MGRHIQPRLLKSVCLHNIAKNMEKRWCVDYYNNFYGQGTYLHVIGPFACLTPDLIQELIHCLVVNGWMKRYYLHMLIDWRFENLDLSVCRKAANKDSIINLITVRCQKLQSLNISGCNQVSSRMLADLVTSLPNITSLSLRHTKCGDQVLTQIGQCCPELRELDVYGCAVTDMGVMSLCVSFDRKRPKVERLLRLDIGFTAVTDRAVEIVLRHCRRLQILDYQDTCAAIYLMDQRGAFDGVDRIESLRLQTLNLMMAADVGCRPDDALRLSCSRCPYVTSVHIHGGVTDDGLVGLSALRHLRTLYLTNDSVDDITFEGGILPLIQIVGSGLEEFVVSEVNRLDLGLVGRCCPRLRKFGCLTAGLQVATFPVHTHPELIPTDGPAPFRSLEDFRLSLYNERNDFPACYLRLVLQNASRLRELHLVAIRELSDDLLRSVLRTNPLSGLQRLALERCDQLTADPVLDLITADNDLFFVSLRHCQLLTRADAEQLEAAVREHGLDVTIEWS